MNEAIKLAIEKGGYKNPRVDLGSDGNLYTFRGRFHENELENTLTLDPLFWHALGKALGWGETVGMIKGGSPVWLNEANIYFNLLLTGGDVDAFWKELLNSN